MNNTRIKKKKKHCYRGGITNFEILEYRALLANVFMIVTRKTKSVRRSYWRRIDQHICMNRCMVKYLHSKSWKHLSNYAIRGSVRVFPRWGTVYEKNKVPFCLAYRTIKYSLVEAWSGSECCSCIIKPSATAINNASLCITSAGLLLLLLFVCLFCFVFVCLFVFL